METSAGSLKCKTYSVKSESGSILGSTLSGDMLFCLGEVIRWPDIDLSVGWENGRYGEDELFGISTEKAGMRIFCDMEFRQFMSKI